MNIFTAAGSHNQQPVVVHIPARNSNHARAVMELLYPGAVFSIFAGKTAPTGGPKPEDAFRLIQKCKRSDAVFDLRFAGLTEYAAYLADGLRLDCAALAS